ISQSIDDQVFKVGVFVNTDVEIINSISLEVGLDMVQLSGDEVAEDYQGIALPVIRTMHVDDQFDPSVMDSYPAHAVLLDSKVPGQYGGTGQTWSWDRVKLGQISKPLILSGGLNSDNVSDAIERTAPAAIDVSSGVEAAPGRKSPAKLRALFKALANHEGTNEQPFK
ncbi:N-(5'-phosphoribosyl)anthranilate isomerase, partial [Candidatus Neomarinimicrobiota bacterium]